MPLLLAIRTTISLPNIFKEVTYRGVVYIDGAVQNNYPMEIYEDLSYNTLNPLNLNISCVNLHSLGLAVEDQDTIKNVMWQTRKKDPLDVKRKIVSSMIGEKIFLM